MQALISGQPQEKQHTLVVFLQLNALQPLIIVDH